MRVPATLLKPPGKLFAGNYAYARRGETREATVVHRNALRGRPAECSGRGGAGAHRISSRARLEVVPIKKRGTIAQRRERDREPTMVVLVLGGFRNVLV